MRPRPGHKFHLERFCRLAYSVSMKPLTTSGYTFSKVSIFYQTIFFTVFTLIGAAFSKKTRYLGRWLLEAV